MNSDCVSIVRRRTGSLVGACVFVALTQTSAAQDQTWRWRLTPYLWATDVGVDVELDGRQIVNETIPVADLAEDLDTTFQGRVEASRGEVGFSIDAFYVAMSDDVGDFALPQNAGQGAVEWEMEMSIVDIAGTFDPEGDGRGLSFLFGARVIDQRADVEADFTTSGGTSHESYEMGETLVDALAGLRFEAELVPQLLMQAQLDASTGGTDFTWSAFPSLRYAFDDGHASIVAGYRHMEIVFQQEGEIESEVSLSGPVIGFGLSF